MLSYFITLSHTLTQNTPSSESYVKFKRGLEFGDVSYSYAHTDFSDRSGSNVKTTTVVRRMGNPKINDKIPQNMIKMPNGHTVQYWPADMNPLMQNKIKSPLNEPLDAGHYGHYTSYATTHDDTKDKSNWPKKEKDEVKMPTPEATQQAPMRVEKEVMSDILSQDTSPMQFPMNEANMKAMMRQKVVSIGSKIQSITPASQKTQYEGSFKQKLPEIFVPPVGNYDEFLSNCYRLSKGGSYAFSVPDNGDLMKIALALSNGDIPKVKELASSLKMPEQDPVDTFDSQRNTPAAMDNINSQYLHTFSSSELPQIVSTTSNPTMSTIRTAYLAPRVRFRKKINRRPKLPERMLTALRQQARTTVSPSTMTEAMEIVTEANTIANSTGMPQNVNRRRHYEYDY